jgi:hypothetical protein
VPVYNIYFIVQKKDQRQVYSLLIMIAIRLVKHATASKADLGMGSESFLGELTFKPNSER